MVDDVFRCIGTESVVDRDGVESLRHASQVGDLPLRSVLAPQANTKLLGLGNACLPVEMNQTSTEVLAALCDLLVVLPDVCAKLLGSSIIRAMAEALVLGISGNSGLESLVGSVDLGNQASEQRLVCEPPVPVHSALALRLGACERQTVRVALWRRVVELLRALELGVCGSEHGNDEGLQLRRFGVDGCSRWTKSSLRCLLHD
jgi:hypothetical protein